MSWLSVLATLKRQGVPHVLVTIVSVEGSAPREIGAKMVVAATNTYNTIGGGNLEYQATKTARELIETGVPDVVQLGYTLGEDLTQCCGGQVKLMYEVFPAVTLNIVLFGAGHVGTALIKVLSELDCTVQWFDSRESYLPASAVGDQVRLGIMTNPYSTVESCEPNTWFLIMTHSHQIDFELVEAILSRGDARFCGLIASRSKASKFRGRLRRKQFTDTEIASLTAPIGLPLGGSKEPMAVAVSIAAQLLGLSSGAKSNPNTRQTEVVSVST